jgi:hypothetical protein
MSRCYDLTGSAPWRRFQSVISKPCMQPPACGAFSFRLAPIDRHMTARKPNPHQRRYRAAYSPPRKGPIRSAYFS